MIEGARTKGRQKKTLDCQCERPSLREGAKAGGGLRDPVCLPNPATVAREILDWCQRARAQHGKKNGNCASEARQPSSVATASKLAWEDDREPWLQRQRIQRVKHRCRQHHALLTLENKGDYVLVEDGEILHKFTAFLAQHAQQRAN